MSVADNVAFGPRSMKLAESETESRVKALLEVVRLDQFATRKPGQLSGGQQQRVALARALANYPSALLLDEPLGALDLKLRQAMQIELKRIQREVGITFIYVTHDQEEALTMSDRIAVMNEGRVEQIGIAAGDLPFAGLGVRGQLHRRGQPAAGDDGQINSAGRRSWWRATVRFVPSGEWRFSARAAGDGHGPAGAAPAVGRGPVGRIGDIRCTVRHAVFQGPVIRCSLGAPDGTDIVAMSARRKH